MPSSVTHIQTITAGAGGLASFDFTSIPNTYTDLMIVSSGRTSNAGTGDSYALKINNSNGSMTMAYVFNNNNNGAMNAGGTAITSPDVWAGTANDSANVANSFGLSWMYIYQYASTNAGKPWVCDNIQPVYASGTNTAYHFMMNGVWSDTTAINRLTFTPTQTLQQHSSMSLYGIKGL